MAAEYTTSVLQCLPSGAPGTIVTPNATSGANSNWFEITSALAVDSLLAGIDVRPKLGGGVFYEAYYEVDIAVGPPPNPSVIATFPGSNGLPSTDGSGTAHGLHLLPILIDLLPAGSRVWGRLRRWNETDTADWFVSLWTYDKPIQGLVTTTTRILSVLGSSTPFTNNLSENWAQGVWNEITPSAPSDLIIPGLWALGGSNGVRWELDIGKGVAPNEAVLTTISGWQASGSGSPCWVPLWNPLDLISAGERVVVRGRGSHATSSGDVRGVLDVPPETAMSLLTTLPIKLAPASATPLSVTADGTAWVYGWYADFIHSTIAPTCIAGFGISSNGPTNTFVEIELGVGTPGVAGGEVSLGVFAYYITADGNTSETFYPLPVPLDAIAIGKRVAARIRKGTAAASSIGLKLGYYENFPGDTLSPLNTLPLGADGASLTPNGTAWTFSSWVPLGTLTSNSSIYGLAITPTVQEHIEVEIGIGPTGQEQVIARPRYAVHSTTSTGLSVLTLPKIYPANAGTQVSYRLRKSGTSTSAFKAKLLFYGESVLTPFTPCTGGGSLASVSDPVDGPALVDAPSPVVWVVLHLDSGDVPVAWLPLPDNITYHGGDKRPRILSMGRPRRAMSDQFGGLQTPTLELLLADTDRRFRGLMRAEVFTNRELSVWTADDATRRAEGQARRLGHYAMTNIEPIGDFTFKISAAGFLGSEISGFFSEATLDLPKYSRDFFGTLPYTLEGKTIPAHFGYIADDTRPTSTAGPVVLDPTQGHCGFFDGPTFPVFGSADIPGDEPVDLNLVEAAGGSFGAGYTLYVMRTAVIGGVESNPYPICSGQSIAMSGSGNKLQMSGSAVTGATAYRWYISDAPITQGNASPGTFAVVVETAGTSAELLGPSGTPYTIGPPMWAVVVAVMTDGSLTKPQRTLTFDTGVVQQEGFVQRHPFATRPIKIAWTALSGVDEYWVYLRGTTGGSYFGAPDSFKTKFVVPNTQTFLDYLPGMAGGEPVDGLPGYELLRGGVTLDYVGDLVMPDGVTRSAFCVGFGALARIHDLFASDGSVPPTSPLRVTVPTGLYGSIVFAPDKPGWPYATKYVPLSDSSGNTLWVTMIFVDTAHAIAIAAIDGTVPITANICGLTDSSDGLGNMIDSGIRQGLHVLTQWGPRDDGGWRSGPWKTIPTRKTVPVYRWSAFEAVRTHFDLSCAWTLGFGGTAPKLFDFLAAVAINLDVRWSENQHGQLLPHRVDPTAAAVAHFSDGSVLASTRAHIPGHAIPTIVPQTSTLVNRLTYVFKRNYVRPITRATPAEDALLPRQNAEAPDWFSGDIPLPDQNSRNAHKVWKDERIEFAMHRVASGPAWVAARLLQRWAWPLEAWAWPADMLGLDVEVGQVVTLTHAAGVGVDATTGAVDRLMFVTGKELEPSMDPQSAESLDVWIEAEDITPLSFLPPLQNTATMSGNLGSVTSPLAPPAGAYPLGGYVNETTDDRTDPDRDGDRRGDPCAAGAVLTHVRYGRLVRVRARRQVGYQTAETVRTNFNNLDSRTTTLEAGTSTQTFTNKTLNAESSGNVLTIPFKLSLEAAICQNATAVTAWSTPTTNPAVGACITGTNTQRGVLDFADGANALSVQRQLQLPADFTGAIDALLVWHTTATSGDVVWQLQTICVADAETGDPAFNTASTVTDTAKGTTLQFNTATIAGVTTTGCAAGEVLFLKLTRDPVHASDTLAATARLVSLELTVRRAM